MLRKYCQGNKHITVAKLVSHSGDSIFLFPVFIIISVFDLYNLADHTWPIVLGMAVTAILVWFIKILVRKDRPKGSLGKIYRKTDPYSFPSGHAARAFIIVGISIFDIGYLAVLIIAWASIVCISRVVLKLHYWKDILVGSGLGLLIGLIIGLVVN